MNHPFYYIPLKDRELAIIGTEEEIKECYDRLMWEIAEQRRVFTYDPNKEDLRKNVQVHYSLPKNMKQNIQLLKNQLEGDKKNEFKVFVYDATPPRKNITFTVSSSPE